MRFTGRSCLLEAEERRQDSRCSICDDPFEGIGIAMPFGGKMEDGACLLLLGWELYQVGAVLLAGFDRKHIWKMLEVSENVVLQTLVCVSPSLLQMADPPQLVYLFFPFPLIPIIHRQVLELLSFQRELDLQLCEGAVFLL
jgi:hypothetical protein